MHTHAHPYMYVNIHTALFEQNICRWNLHHPTRLCMVLTRVKTVLTNSLKLNYFVHKRELHSNKHTMNLGSTQSIATK